MKTAEFGQPCEAPVPGKCRICGGSSAMWADETETLCIRTGCLAAARAELTTHSDEADQLLRPYEGKRYGFAPR